LEEEDDAEDQDENFDVEAYKKWKEENASSQHAEEKEEEESSDEGKVSLVKEN